jgi:Ni,Fe-hydrogenase maturation factor
MTTFILGYGNQSRRDDGVGWFASEQLRDEGLTTLSKEP